MLSKKELNNIKNELETAERPLFFFHDDADGLCSFLILYKHVNRGKGHAVKVTPHVTKDFVRYVIDYDPDKIFVLDIAVVDQEFLDEVKLPVVWIDHHEPLKRKKVKYYNPRIENPEAYIPVSQICYEALKENLWLGTIGTVGDGSSAGFVKDFAKKYPDILDPKIKERDRMQFETKLAELIKIFNFNLKGSGEDVKKSIKIFTRIKDPYELLNQTTPQGRFIYKRYEKIKEEYDTLLKEALNIKPKNAVYVFKYTEKKTSLSSEIANFMFYKFPKATIVIAREKGDEVKCSLRSNIVDLRKVIKDALKEIEGFGGGHEVAAAIVIKKKDFNRFLEIVQEAL